MSTMQQQSVNETISIYSVAVWKKDLGIVRALASSRGLRGRMFEAALQGYLACGERFGFEKDDSCFTKMLAGEALRDNALGREC